MAAIDKLLKYLKSYNVADSIDEDKRLEIASDVIMGYEIDSDSRQHWLDINKAALQLVKTTDDIVGSTSDKNHDFPFSNSSKVVYPLIGPAIIQLAARLNQHVVRNGRVVECEVLGKDQPEIDPHTNQPTGLGIKESKSKRVSDYLSYKLLNESDTWLPDEYKLNSIVAAWGTGFKEVYYDKVLKTPCSELLPPEDVIVNHNLMGTLDSASRITIRYYLTQNQIVSKMRSGEFLDLDLENLNNSIMDNERQNNDSREVNPIYELLRQFCYLDLDDDDFAEPYWVWVHKNSKTVFSIVPAFEVRDIKLNPTGKIVYIKPRHNIVDRHLIDDPEGKFYSIGLNHMLYHSAKGITTTLRQLHDAGTLRNAASVSGFCTKLVKTKERTIRPKLGQYTPVDIPPEQRIQDQFMNLPMEEPSQTLLNLLQLQIDAAKQLAFMTDILTGDSQTQNVPATTMLAQVEQSTRAFGPMVAKEYASQKKEFKIHVHMYSMYMDQEEYFKFQDCDQQICAEDFDESSLDICPVADPTMSSDAHKFARAQILFQLFQTPTAQECNLPEALTEFFTILEFPNAESMAKPPAPPPPDPKLLDVQRKAQKDHQDGKLEESKQFLQATKLDLEDKKIQIHAAQTGAKINESKAKTAKIIVDAHRDAIDISHGQHSELVNKVLTAHELDSKRIESLTKAHLALNPPKDTSNE